MEKNPGKNMEKNIKKGLIRKISGIAVGTLIFVILAILSDYFMTLDYFGLFTAIRCEDYSCRYTSLADLKTVDCDFDGQTVITASDNPQIYIDGLNCFVRDIQICLTDLSVSTVDVTVYYSQDGTYSEDSKVSGVYKENQGCLLLYLNQDVSSLRIDLGDLAGISYDLSNITVNPHTKMFIANSLKNLSLPRIIIYFLLIVFMFSAVSNWADFKKYLFRYRWQLGAVLIVVCTLLKLHGSSIGYLTNILSGADTSRLWGTERAIRSDEWVVFTEMALSQVKSGFKWFSEIWGYSASDMYIVYGQPVMNFVTIFRPFSAFYILLGAEYGLAFYWCARFIILFLVSFEFGRIVTKDDRVLSVAYAFLTAFSPLVQWWFSINGLVEMLIFGQAVILLFNLFAKTSKIYCKILCTAGMFVCAGGYAMTLYPAWMIPFAYVFVTCFIAYLIENRHDIHLKAKDIVILASGVILLAVCMLYILNRSSDTIKAVMSTIYPGKRQYTGGPLINIMNLFKGWSAGIWSFTDCENPCEKACFLSFFPMGILLSIYLFIKEKKKDVWLIALNICNVLFILYYLFPVANIISKITFLGYSSKRLGDVIAFLNMLILMRALTLYRDEEGEKYIPADSVESSLEICSKPEGRGIKLLPLPAFIIAGFSLYTVEGYVNTGTKFLIVAFVIASCLLIYLSYKNNIRKIFVIFTIIVSVIGGFLVNPVESGLSTLYDSYIVQSMNEINTENPGTWFINGNFTFANLPEVVGADCINALETYPDYALWETLGLEEDSDIWNRYCHLDGEIGDETSVELLGTDHVCLHVTMDDLKKLGVDYIFSTSELGNEDNAEGSAEGVSETAEGASETSEDASETSEGSAENDYELLDSYRGCYIYRIIY